MVLDAGKIAEFESPAILLKDKSSMFAALANEAGSGEVKGETEKK
jgi:hypothetical protein